MRILKPGWHRRPAVWMIGIATIAVVLSVLGFLVWPDEKTDKPEPYKLVVLDKTPLNMRLLSGDNFVASSLELDPYDASLLRLTHRPYKGAYKGTFLAPPRLISKFSPRENIGGNWPTTSALWLVALLPDLALRTRENHHLFEREHADRLEVTITANQPLGRVPDLWHRQFITCEKTAVLHLESIYPGLTVNATRLNKGFLRLKGCQPVDALPDGNPPLLVCSRDHRSRELTTCQVEFVIPWHNYPEEIQSQQPRYQDTGHFRGRGNVVSFKFPASYLPQWRRIRSLSLCLVEAVIDELDSIEAPSRVPEFCKSIKSALQEKKAILAPGSGGDN